jgi:hypothetical protein
LRFVDGLGIEIPETGERRFRGNVFDLMAPHAPLGIDHRTTTPDLGWGRPDYTHILSVIRPYPASASVQALT